MASKSKCTKKIREDKSGVDFLFANGETLSLNLSDLQGDMATNLVLHGISQKVGDAYAGAESVEDAQKSASEMIDRLIEGIWKTVRAAGAKKSTTLLVEALTRALDKTVEEVMDVLEDKSDEEKAAMQKHPQIQPIIQAIKIEREQAKLEKLTAEATESAEEQGSLADLLG